MKRFLAFLFALLALPALADDFVARNGKDTVRLTQAECPKEVMAILDPALREKVRSAMSVLNGKEYRACWTLMVPGFVNLLYEDGDEGMVPLEDFKREAGI